MWSQGPTLGVLFLLFICQVCATSLSQLQSEFNSPANISARARVQKPTRCPKELASYDSMQWTVYPSTSRVTRCNQTMLLDFMLYNPLNNSDSRHTIYSTVANSTTTFSDASSGTSCLDISTQSDATYQVGFWGAADSDASDLDLTPLQAVNSYMTGNCQKSTIFSFSESENMAVGIYVGGSVQHTLNVDFAVEEMTKILEAGDSSSSMILQYCGTNSNYTLGIAVDLTGNIAAVQQYVKTWSDGGCVSGFTKSETVATTLYSTNFNSRVSTSNSSSQSNSTLSIRSHGPHGHTITHTHSQDLHRRSTCSYVQVISGDSCPSLVTECDITDAELYEYNTASDLCSTLAVGQYICCSSGSLPDFAPTVSSNGTCYTYNVASGDTCSAIAATYSLTVDDIDSFNDDTWGWYGCDDLQAGQAICLSNGTAPYPESISSAVCGPQVPGTNFTGTDGAADWAALNPCPLNACCDIWGECGATPDYCNDTLAASGAPGTAPAGSNGCIFNCGTTIVNTATAPASYSAVGYFEAYNVERSCLNMNAISIDVEKYTHVHFAFGNITSNFSISIAGQEQQFEYFRELAGVKQIMSFGGWDFSTNIDTYMIFREGVAADNRDTLVSNIVDFVTTYALDGVDFDWEYPGEPDIAGIPAGSDEDGSNYLAFLEALRTAMPDKSISISAPASYWYLKAFPIAEIADVVDYIIYMTYDLHGTWDLGDEWAQDGCTAGDCLFSHVNLTETLWALSMITKAPVATSSIMVGVTSYGRSFEMTTAGCYTSDCTWDAAGAAGPCTDTAGYISNAEINQILAENSNSEQLFSSGDDSDIVVYNDTQWVAYMTNTTKSTRTAYYETFNFAGTSEWAIDLEEYELYFDASGDDLVELEAYGDSLSLDVTVDYDLACINLVSGVNTTAELEKYIVLAATEIDAVLTEYSGDPKDWFAEMTSGHSNGGDSCVDFPAAGCTALSEQYCADGDISDALFWASYIAQQLYQILLQWYSAFNEASFISGMDIATIADTFAPTTDGDTSSFASLLSTFSSSLGIAATVVPEVDGVNTAVSTVSSFVSLLPSASDFSLPTSSDLATALESMMETVINATLTALADLSTDIFEYPNRASNLPSDLITGPFTHDVANYIYNTKPLFEIDADSWLSLVDTFNVTMKKAMVGTALGAGDYYILRDASTSEDDCTGTAKYYIDGSCYTLAYPGLSTCTVGNGLSTHAEADTIASIISYGIDVENLITISYDCQNATGEYFGTVDADISSLTDGGSLPTCFYNLPVLDLLVVDGKAPDTNSPCWLVLEQSATTNITGETYLPDNLYSIFEDDCECHETSLCARSDLTALEKRLYC
ncbi:hypothetical protein N7466_006809 [Penicillium verhagenii]|uniref:uncharacterized protein n=1 Tax=Penicillium verhagenii TaxID=1562060 RepID=UPI00254521B4|nr:uncharacterized protein N7466_006809 [Penicillium verhagenii]KAJ5927853.1 hypothetical protein N7466_006809 [Penicillium verhagenii]